MLSLLVLSGCSSPEQRAQASFERGEAFADKGELVKAALEFRTALQIKDDLVPAIFALGQIAEQQGDLVTALRSYRDVAERELGNVSVRIRLARLLLAGGQLDEASKYVDEAYALDAPDPDVLALKAETELMVDNRSEAVRLADEALKIDPENLAALMVRAAERLKASAPEAALPFLDRATEKNARSVALQLLRIKTYIILEDKAGIEGAFSNYLTTIQATKDFVMVWQTSISANIAAMMLRKCCAGLRRTTLRTGAPRCNLSTFF